MSEPAKEPSPAEKTTAKSEAPAEPVKDAPKVEEASKSDEAAKADLSSPDVASSRKKESPSPGPAGAAPGGERVSRHDAYESRKVADYKTANAKLLVENQMYLLNNLHSMKSEMDDLDREIDRLNKEDAECRRQAMINQSLMGRELAEPEWESTIDPGRTFKSRFLGSSRISTRAHSDDNNLGLSFTPRVRLTSSELSPGAEAAPTAGAPTEKALELSI